LKEHNDNWHKQIRILQDLDSINPANKGNRLLGRTLHRALYCLNGLMKKIVSLLEYTFEEFHCLSVGKVSEFSCLACEIALLVNNFLRNHLATNSPFLKGKICGFLKIEFTLYLHS
jgi:hypothetical protein